MLPTPNSSGQFVLSFTDTELIINDTYYYKLANLGYIITAGATSAQDKVTLFFQTSMSASKSPNAPSVAFEMMRTQIEPAIPSVEALRSFFSAKLSGNSSNLYDLITDIFGRVEAATPTVILDATQILYDHAEMFATKITGTAAATWDTTTKNHTDLTASANGSVVFQTRRHGYYQPGMALIVAQTGQLKVEKPGETGSGQTSRIGYFDEGNGYFFQYISGDLRIVERAYGADFEVEQADWNVDKFDGKGPSGVTLDPTKSNIFVTALQWLGVGLAAVGLKIGKRFYPAHVFTHANETEGAYMQSAILPCRWELSVDAASPDATMRAICCMINSNGGFNPRGFITPVESGTAITVSAETPILAVRAKAGFERITLNPIRIQPFVSTADTSVFRVYIAKASALTGATWEEPGVSWPNAKTGVLERAIGSVTPMTLDAAGVLRLISSTSVSSANNNKPTIVTKFLQSTLPGREVDGDADVIVLTVQNLSGGSADVRATIDIQEWI